MAQRQFVLEHIHQGDFISWFVSTQSAASVTVSLKDETGKKYFEGKKQSTAFEPPLAQGFGLVTGKKLTVTVDIPPSREIKGDAHHYAITNEKGVIVGNEYTICLEDYIDDDYNDAAISITAWKAKG